MKVCPLAATALKLQWKKWNNSTMYVCTYKCTYVCLFYKVKHVCICIAEAFYNIHMFGEIYNSVGVTKCVIRRKEMMLSDD